MLSLSAETIGRMVRDGRLPRLKGVRHILIPATQLEQWITDNTVYTSDCVAKESKSGDHSWIDARRRRAYTRGRIRQTGTPLIQTQAVEELSDLLGLS